MLSISCEMNVVNDVKCESSHRRSVLSRIEAAVSRSGNVHVPSTSETHACTSCASADNNQSVDNGQSSQETASRSQQSTRPRSSTSCRIGRGLSRVGGGAEKKKLPEGRSPIVPTAVAERLAAFRNKREGNNKNNLTLSNILSLAAVQREIQDNHVIQPSSPHRLSRGQLRERSSGQRSDSYSAREGSTRLPPPKNETMLARIPRDLARSALAFVSADFVRPLFGDGLDPLSVKSLSYVTPEVNKKIRMQLLGQHWFTNRFIGSQEAQQAELEFSLMVSRYQLQRVRGRLFLAGLVTTLSAIEPFVARDRAGVTNILLYVFVRTVVPCLLFLLAAGLCSWSRTRGLWRLLVCLTCILAYNAILWPDALTNRAYWSGPRQDYSTMLQCLWLLIAAQFTALAFSLDFVHVLVTVLIQWVCFVLGIVNQWKLWRSDHLALCVAFARGEFDVQDEQSAAEGLFWCNVTGARHSRSTEGVSVFEASLVALLGVLILLASVNRSNRFERQSFVNQYVLLHKTVSEEKKKRGGERMMLALFSNPNAPLQLHLKPLQLGQELKFLLRSIPPSDLAVEPAAALEDVKAAIERCHPRLVLFSGHSFAGSLAFELPNGRIELPTPQLFIEQLEKAQQLCCCFLNGCNTGELAHQIVQQLPWLKVICWTSVAEDAAARSFALGFYDAVGAILASGEDIAKPNSNFIELSFWAGLERFASDGFRLGDPSLFLHPPSHPHSFRPVFSPTCFGCTPPVHGDVQLYRAAPGWIMGLDPAETTSMVERLVIDGHKFEQSLHTWEAIGKDGKPVGGLERDGSSKSLALSISGLSVSSVSSAGDGSSETDFEVGWPGGGGGGSNCTACAAASPPSRVPVRPPLRSSAQARGPPALSTIKSESNAEAASAESDTGSESPPPVARREDSANSEDTVAEPDMANIPIGFRI